MRGEHTYAYIIYYCMLHQYRRKTSAREKIRKKEKCYAAQIGKKFEKKRGQTKA